MATADLEEEVKHAKQLSRHQILVPSLFGFLE